MERNCIECGRTIITSGRGRPPLRCGECKRGRRRLKERQPVTCVDCGTVFPPPGHTGLPPKRCERCAAARKREKDREKQARWREANPERAREHWNKSNRKRLADPAHLAWKREDAMKRAYGIGQAEFDQLLAAQGGVCAICGGGRNGPGSRLHIDHCHDSNRIRGLLCGKCNTAVGLLDDDPARAEALAEYLRR